MLAGMRALVVVVCTLLLSSSALAQDRGRGGPNMDPLGDRQHAEPETKGEANVSTPRRVKLRVKTRTIRRTRTLTSAASAPKKAPAKAPTKGPAKAPAKAAQPGPVKLTKAPAPR
jgi:hypothetical protein